MNASSASRIYGTLQSIVLVAFAAAVLFGRSGVLFSSGVIVTLGSVLCVAGGAVMAAAFVSLRNVIQIAPEPRADGHLVTGGIYRGLRHPIYTAIVAIVVGLFLRRPTLWTGIAAALVIVFLYVKSRYEERLLEDRYPQYATYRKHTLWGLLLLLFAGTLLSVQTP